MITLLAAETTQASAVTPFLLLAAALVLIVAEFIIPSFGLIALVSIVMIIAGGISIADLGINWLAAYVVSAVIALPICILAGLQLMKRSPLSIQGEQIPVTEAPSIAKADSGLPVVGALGKAESALRPAGKAVFGGKLTDVTADGDFIDAGSAVRVVNVAGNRVTVRQQDD